ncbi:MAG: hypothetical protein R3B07_13660 [Polyangiaceae bacterium]
MQPEPPGANPLVVHQAGIANPALTAAPPTVWGTSLRTGERVIYYFRDTSYNRRMIQLVLGIILIPLCGLGLLMLYGYFTHDSKETTVLVITTQRMLGLSPNRTLLDEIQLGNITEVIHTTGRTNRYRVWDNQKNLISILTYEHPSHLLEPILADLKRANEFPTVDYEP